MPKVTRDIASIKLSEEEEKELSARLQEMVSKAEDYHSGWDQLHADYQRAYLAQPEHDKKDFPWPNSSNLFIPLTRAVVDSTAAQFFDAMLSGAPKVVGTGPEDQEASTLLTQYYFEYVFQSILNLKLFGSDWNMDTFIDGTSAVKNYWNKDFLLSRQEVIEQRPITKKRTVSFLGEDVEQDEVVDVEEVIHEDLSVERAERPVIEVVDLSKLLVAPGSRAGLQYPDCPWYYEDTTWTWEQALDRKRQGFEHIDEELEATLQEEDVTLKEQENREEQELSFRSPTSVNVKVFYMRLVLPGRIRLEDGTEKDQSFNQKDGHPEEAVVWYLSDTSKISRVVPLSRIRPDARRPHVDNRYVRVNRSFYGLGIPATLRHINKLINTSFNQMVDYGTLRNIPWGLIEPATTGLSPGRLTIRPGELIPVLNAGGATFPRLQGDTNFWLQLLQQGQVWSERTTSVTDFTVGRQPQLPNAPRTARGTLALMQQASIAFSYRVALMVESYLELFRQIHVLYRKHSPQEEVFRFFNRETGLFERRTVERRHFAADVDFQFELNPNRLQEQQTNQALFQLVVPYLLQQVQMGLQDFSVIRNAAKELLFDAEGKKNFERIWPEPQQPQVGGLGGGGLGGLAPGGLGGQAGLGQQPTTPAEQPPDSNITL